MKSVGGPHAARGPRVGQHCLSQSCKRSKQFSFLRYNECIMHIYSKYPFHRHHCIQSHSDTRSQAGDLIHNKQTIYVVQVIMEKTDLVQL